ncbi:leucine-rich repeat domain-containing protein [Tundrisphaera sp. TA3]|uniref:leucine-rich repeat domain-containing protein n=1 Tax=Tundrisphaera sp. TA3 TaxID=3435775 RepID=UPI003EC0F08A
MNGKRAFLMVLIGVITSPSIGVAGRMQAASDGQETSDDARIVRRLLDENGLAGTPVSKVAVQRDGRVVELKLYGKKTSLQNLPSSLRSIPPEIGRLDGLKKLVIASNDLPELPEAIYGLTDLVELDLSNNGLESVSSKVGQLKRLRKLNLAMNSLIEVPESIGELSELTDLDLMANQLRSIPGKIGSLSRLETLGIRSNHLADLPRSIAGLKRLKSLNLIENRLTAVPEVVYALTSLRALYLSDNEIETISPRVGFLPRLESLTLDHNKLRSLPDEIRNLVGLDYFSIDANQIEDIDAAMARIFPGKRKPRHSHLTQDLVPGQAADKVFTISKAPPRPDGRPVIDIKPNGKNRPAGTGPSGSYLLIVRQNGHAFYVRWFSPNEATTGTRYDLAIPNIGLAPGDKLTVGVENVNPSDPSDYVKLSNALDVPHPSPMPPSRPAPKGPR